MSWICSCEVVNVNSNSYCAVCKTEPRPVEYSLSFDSFEELVYAVFFYSIDRALQLPLFNNYDQIAKGTKMPMTPEEELFAKFFKNEAERIIDLTDIDLRLRREELIEIIKEAKARLTAVREQERDREAKNKKSSGFSRSVDADEIASEAINKINKRNKSLSKMDKVIEGLMKSFGMSRAEAEAITSARSVKDHQEIKASQGFDVESLKSPKEEKTNQPAFNPFAEKKPEVETVVSIHEDVVIIKETEVKTEDKTKPFNPFEPKE